MMLDTSYILSTLKNEESNLKQQFHINKIGIFGSYARREQTGNSDIDIYVEFAPEAANFANVAGLWNYLEELFHKKIDLVYPNKNTADAVLSHIQNEVIYC